MAKTSDLNIVYITKNVSMIRLVYNTSGAFLGVIFPYPVPAIDWTEKYIAYSYQIGQTKVVIKFILSVTSDAVSQSMPYS